MSYCNLKNKFLFNLKKLKATLNRGSLSKDSKNRLDITRVKRLSKFSKLSCFTEDFL